jgi:hypothetical protein
MLASVKLGVKVGKLAMYEAPYNDDQESQRTWAQYLSGLAEALGDGRRGDAVALFMQLVGMPAEQVDGMRAAPFWPGMEAIGPTLAYDHAAIQGPTNSVPTDVASRVPAPALVMAGDASFPFMLPTAGTLSQAMPHGQLRILEGQTHEVSAAVLAPVLAEFFAS